MDMNLMFQKSPSQINVQFEINNSLQKIYSDTKVLKHTVHKREV